MAKKRGERLDTRCRIEVHSKRTRLADPDGVSVKAVLDGLTKTDLLEDDSSKFIKEISFTQEKSTEDETIIDLYWD